MPGLAELSVRPIRMFERTANPVTNDPGFHASNRNPAKGSALAR